MAGLGLIGSPQCGFSDRCGNAEGEVGRLYFCGKINAPVAEDVLM